MSLDSFAKRLNELMHTGNNISKRTLSIKTGVQRKSISNWLIGRFYPRYDSLIKLANYFNISTDYLLGLDDELFYDKFVEIDIRDVSRVFIIRLKMRLEQKQLSYYKLAKILGIGQSSISKWIYGNSMPETAIIIKIAKVLNESIDYFLGRID